MTSSQDAKDRNQPPEMTTRWFYAFEDGWQAFNDHDDERLENRWQELEEEGFFEKVRLKQRQKAKEEEDRKKDEQKQSEKERQEEEECANKSKSGKSNAWPPSGVDQIRAALFGFNTSNAKANKEAKTKKEAGEVRNDEGQKIVTHHLDPDEPEETRKKFVAVMEDKLFDADLESMELFPVFWKGVLLRIVRANWFYLTSDGGFAPIPFDEDLSKDLDEAYDKAKPWNRAESDIKKEKGSSDSNSEDLFDLPSMPNTGKIKFESATSGRIFTQDLSGKLLSVLGGSLVIRGWKETANRSKQLRNTSIFTSSFLPWAGGQEPNERERKDAEQDGEDVENDTFGTKRAKMREGAARVPDRPKQQNEDESANPKQSEEENQGWLGKLWPSSDSLLQPRVKLLQSLGWSKDDAVEEGQRSAKQQNTEEALRNEGEEDSEDAKGESQGGEKQNAIEEEEPISEAKKDEPPELVLAIHGIGQKLTDDFDAIDFVYDIERLRNLTKKLSNDKAIQRISQGKRAQFIPICWRKELSFDDQEALEGNDNVYGLRDVSNDATIPMVRNIISKVILDVPYYLSRHKKTMIEAVIQELNRVYRLFVRRNPDFEEKGGRVSLICHSLGSALAADILSYQPTKVSRLSKQSQDELRSTNHLVFNVKNLFFVGSPNGFFFHLQGAQLIARKGTARTQDVEEDAARDEVGRYGCLAAESIYNCYNATDPVAFQLSATIDRDYAKMLRPISIPDAVPALLDALAQPKLSLSKYFEAAKPFAKSSESEAGKHPGTAVYKDMKSGTRSPLPKVDQKMQRSDLQRSSSVEEIGKPVLVERGSAQKVEQVKIKAERVKKGDTFDLARLQRAERRFRALNPHGCIDFLYDSGGMNQYLDMLSAHISYWTSKSFAIFVLTQLFSDFEAQKNMPTIVPKLRTEFLQSKEKDNDGMEK